MAEKLPRLRDGRRRITSETYPLGQIPDQVLRSAASHFAYLQATGRSNIGGDDWGDAFAEAIGGSHLASPLGIADVICGGVAWSTKTVKGRTQPGTPLRLISGRNSPDYSMGIENPHQDVSATGKAVLSIWNSRVQIAHDQYRSLRTAVLVRGEDDRSFAMFEEECRKFVPNAYRWEVNKNGNFLGIDRISGAVCFTWQPHGSQFTVHSIIPEEARRFTISPLRPLTKAAVLKSLGWSTSSVDIRQ